MLLFYIYIAAFVVGGILLAASLFLGHQDADSGDVHVDAAEADAGADADAHVEADAHVDAHADLAGGHGTELSDFWLPFVSVRFWVFFLCFFGLTGTIFSLLALAGKWMTLVAAVGMGAVTGFAAAFIIQRLKSVEVGKALDEEDFKGQEGTVMLPLSPGGQGKIRLEVGGNIVDLVARSEEQTPIERGRKVLVIDFKEGEAVVVGAQSYGSDLEAVPPQRRESAGAPQTGASEPKAKGE
jgi:membrane protein implicated in regulation of membrane protease activity